MYVITISLFFAFDLDRSSFLCQFKGKITVYHNLTVNLGYSIIYHTTFLDTIGRWDTATEYLSDAFNAIVDSSLTKTSYLCCQSCHSAVNEETQFLSCHHCHRF